MTPTISSASAGDVGRREGLADVLATGFGTTVAMWTVGYVCRLPPAVVPNAMMAAAMLACVVVGGFVAGRYGPRGWRGGLYVGIVSSLLNMLILGSLLTGDRPNQIVPSAMLWIPGAVFFSALLGAGGGAIGARSPRTHTDTNWSARFACTAAAATLLLLIAGGLVTSADAGLAVVDWPNSFGYNMFLYPLGRMTGGIYYEHAHRLFGSLVGLTVLVLALHVQRSGPSRWLKLYAWLTLLCVIVQGVLGGLRVTGRFTLSTSPHDTAPSITLAIVHGVFGQIVFGMIVSFTVLLSRHWQRPAALMNSASAATDRGLHVLLVCLLVIQLVLGALLRHISDGLLIHISTAAIVILLALACGLRAWGLYGDIPVLRRIGAGLVFMTAGQVFLGIAALVAVGLWSSLSTRPPAEVVLATAHQALGAAILACAVMLMLFHWRLVAPANPAA